MVGTPLERGWGWVLGKTFEGFWRSSKFMGD